MHGFLDFESAVIDTGETTIFVRHGGSGPPLLLLHGFPQTHIMWRKVVSQLFRQFTIVCADLRGYGKSGCPPSTSDHGPYAYNGSRYGGGDGPFSFPFVLRCGS